MKDLTFGAALSACGGLYDGDPDILGTEITAITSDSREAKPGCLFAAIPGNRVDGHDFIEDVAKKGAACALVCREVSGSPIPTILVPDTQAALGNISGFYRAVYDIPFIGVTGSVGKTTTKQMLASVLSNAMDTLWTDGNFNNELGVPLTLFRLRENHRAAVIEMGISDFGEMGRLSEMVKPQIAIITIIGESHLEMLGDRQGVLKAKTEILQGMSPEGILIINGDDDLLRGFSCGNKKISYGIDSKSDLMAKDIKLSGTGGMSCTIYAPAGGFEITAKIPAYGKHLVYAALAACAAAIELGISVNVIEEGLAKFEPTKGRAMLQDTGRFCLIDDSYNANPNSMKMSISSMATLKGRKVCILGDMLELGEESAAMHRSVGEYAASSGVDVLISFGERARDIHLGSRDAGGEIDARRFTDRQELINALPDILKDGDNVLVKASNSMKFGEFVEAIKSL